MNILARLVASAVELLIAIGDFVILIINFPFSLLSKIKVRKRVRSGTFKIKAPRTKTPAKRDVLSLASGIRRIFSPFLFVVLFVFSLVIWLIKLIYSATKVLLFAIPRWIQSYRKNSGEKQAEKLAKTRRDSKIKNGIYKPSIFYKLKYIFIGSIFSCVFIFVPAVAFLFVSELPDPGNLSVSYIPKTTKIYDRNGSLLYEIYATQNRTVVKLQDVPKHLRDATIAIEDKDFYSHPGFDLRGIVRALITNIRKEGFQGGSTITQQLIKSAFLTPEPSIIRKIKEVALAFWAERIYTKDQILELYLNYVPYGGTAWGIQAASEIYFGKKAQELTLSESAFLAGLPRAPSVYSPYFGNGSLWKTRQKEVLDAMVRLGYIGKDDAEQASLEELSFRDPQIPIKAPHFVMYVRKILIDRFGLNEVERGGLQVTTSLDLKTHEKIQEIVAGEVDSNSHLNITNGAALITNPKNGDVLAMIGSKNYFDENYDGNVNLTTSLRQPGSSIKLVTYALALSQGYTEATILDDTPLTIVSEGEPPYSPVNYDGAFHGKVPLRTAFANSFNVPAVRVAQKLGAKSIKDYGEKLGISSWKNVTNYGVSITLGGADVRMTDLVTAYGTIANGGERIDLDPILEVKNSYGETIYEKIPKPIPVVDPGISFILADILSDNNARSTEFGLITPLSIPGRKVSVKTGTTDNKRDNWTVGFTPEVVVGAWVGNNDNTPMNQALASGITGAAPMWNKIMTLMLNDVATPSATIVPSNVVKKFCLGQDRYFIAGTENTVSCRSLPTTPTPILQVN
jgi:penicillin-binding protein 1C